MPPSNIKLDGELGQVYAAWKGLSYDSIKNTSVGPASTSYQAVQQIKRWLDDGRSSEEILGFLDQQNPNNAETRADAQDAADREELSNVTLPGETPAPFTGVLPSPAAPPNSTLIQRLMDEKGLSLEEAQQTVYEMGPQDAYAWLNDTSSGSVLIQRLMDEKGLSLVEAQETLDEMGAKDAYAWLNGTSSGSGSGKTPPTAGELENQRLNNELLQRELDSNPYLQVGTDNTTGRSFLIDTQTGKRTDIGQTDFAGVDPERKFQSDLGQANQTDSRLGRTAEVTAGLQKQGLIGDAFTEDRLRSALGLDSQIAQGNLDLGISQEDRLRQALGLDAQVAQGNFDVQASQEDRLRQALGLQRDTSRANVNLGVNQEDRLRNTLGADVQSTNQQADQFRFQQLREVLANPSDFLARAFLQRGQTSPSGQVTQADLINALRSEIRDVEAPQYNQTIQQLQDSSQIGNIDYQTGLPDVNIDQPQFGGGLPTNRITSPTFDTNVNDLLSQINSLNTSIPTQPVTSPYVAPVNAQQPAPAPVVDADRSRLLSQLDPNMASSVDSTVPNSFLQQLVAIKQQQDAYRLAQQTRLAAASAPAPTSKYIAPAPTVNAPVNTSSRLTPEMERAIYPPVNAPVNTSSGLSPEMERAIYPPVNAPVNSRVKLGFAAGGATRLPMFMTGDSPSGVPTGNEEVILNPTGAPINVIPNPQNMPRMAGGTGDDPNQMLRLMQQLKLQMASGGQGGVPRFASGTFGTDPFSSAPGSRGGDMWAGPPMPFTTYENNAPTQQGVTQDQIIKYAQDFSPPAVSSLFNGQRPDDLQFGFSLFTPQQLNQLTSDEQKALQTRLGAEFNTTLSDVGKSQQQRFGATRQRSRGRFQL